MKFFRSTWFVAIVALLFGIGLQTFVMMSHVEELATAAAAAVAEEVVDPHVPPTRINWDFLSPEMEDLRKELQERVTAVGRREEDLQDYEKRLQAERAEIEKLKREIEAVRDDLAKRLIEIETSEQKNLKSLAVTYGEMEADATLLIFQKMDDEMVVKILAFMKPAQVGPILAEMARTKDGDSTLAGRAATLSYKLRLLRQVKPETSTSS
jgi:flagellar motility protein MotE (MotC chaperone)